MASKKQSEIQRAVRELAFGNFWDAADAFRGAGLLARSEAESAYLMEASLSCELAGAALGQKPKHVTCTHANTVIKYGDTICADCGKYLREFVGLCK